MDFLHYAFMQRALIAGALIGAATGAIGVYVMLRGLSFIGAGIAHAAFGGVAIGTLAGIDPLASALVFSLAVALGIGYTTRRAAIREDVAVGILFAASMALGIFLLSFVPGYTQDLFGYLFGNILAVGPADLWFSLGLFLVVFGAIALFFKEFLYITFDPEMALVSGLPAGAIYGLLLSLIAFVIVLSIRVVGIILVSALLVAPAATAFQLTEDFRRLMFLSVLLGVGETLGGLVLSYYTNTPSGATIVLLSTALFFLAFLLSPRRRAVRVLPGR